MLNLEDFKVLGNFTTYLHYILKYIENLNSSCMKCIGELTLTNYPATRFYLNCNHHATEDLKTRLSKFSTITWFFIYISYSYVLKYILLLLDLKNPTFYENIVSQTNIKEVCSPIMKVSEIKELESSYIQVIW